MTSRLPILVGFLAIGTIELAHAEKSAFQTKSGHEIILRADKHRSITGEVRTEANVVASVIEGTNPAPGHLKLKFIPRSDPTMSGAFVFEFRPCENPTRSLFKKPDCGSAIWVSKDAPATLSRLKYCFDSCRIYKLSDDTEQFDALLNWSTSWDNYVGALSFSVTRAKRPGVINCLRSKGITGTFEGDSYLNVPPGLEDIARAELKRCGFGKVEQPVTEKGSETIPLAFPAGTFFTAPISLANIADTVADMKSKLRQGFTDEGLETDVKQGRKGGLSFLITVTAHADKFPFPAGNWFQSTIQVDFTERPEPNVPQGKVQQGELHVIGTLMFHGPSSVHPSTNQFQPIARVDRSLNDAPVDSVLSIELANRLASRFHGAIVQTPEGF
jgi:hypothetical protein